MEKYNFHFKKPVRSRPCGLVVKFSAFCFSSLGPVPRHGPTPLVSSHAVAASHIQNRRRLATDVSSGLIFLSKEKKKKKKKGMK